MNHDKTKAELVRENLRLKMELQKLKVRNNPCPPRIYRVSCPPVF